MSDTIAASNAASSGYNNTSAAGEQPTLIRSAADITRLVNQGATKLSDARIVVAIALGGVFLDAYDLGGLAFGMKDITRQFGLSPSGAGLVASAITLGAIVGALFGGYLTDKIGRYRVFMADMFFFVIAALACAFAPNEWVLGVSRFVMGVGVGIDLPVAMAFLAEFSKLSGRGNKASRVAMWCPTWYAAISISYLLVLLLYAVLPAEDTGLLWRLILGFGAVPALLIIAIRHRYMNESPVWTANQGDLKGAAAILRRSYNINVEVAEDANLQAQPEVRKAAWSNYAELWKGVYFKRTLLVSVISIASPFAYNAVAFGLPVILSTFLKQSVIGTILFSLGLNLCFAFVGGLLAVRFVSKFGAWNMTVIGYAFQLIAMIGLALVGRPTDSAEAAISISMLALFLFGQGIGPGSHSMTYASLSYPTSLRGTGVGLSQVVSRVSSTVSLFLFPVLTAALGTKVFWAIGIAPLVGVLILLAIRWEPSGYDVDAEDFEKTV